MDGIHEWVDGGMWYMDVGWVNELMEEWGTWTGEWVGWMDGCAWEGKWTEGYEEGW
jgi:hypothetical protein